MRSGALSPFACLAFLALALAGCAAPAQPEPAAFEGKTLLVRPYLFDGSLRTQAIVNPKTSMDIATLEIVPYVHVGNDEFWPIAVITGEATDSTDLASLVKVRQAGFDADRQGVIALTGLRPKTRYRIVARAYDASDSLISTVDARSYAEVTVQDDNRPEFPLKLPVTLVDTPFGTTRSLALTISGGAFATIDGTLYKVFGENLEVVPDGTLKLTPENASRRVTFNNLEARTTYRLTLRALNEGAIPIATKSIDWTITNDDEPVHADVVWDLSSTP